MRPFDRAVLRRTAPASCFCCAGVGSISRSQTFEVARALLDREQRGDGGELGALVGRQHRLSLAPRPDEQGDVASFRVLLLEREPRALGALRLATCEPGVDAGHDGLVRGGGLLELHEEGLQPGRLRGRETGQGVEGREQVGVLGHLRGQPATQRHALVPVERGVDDAPEALLQGQRLGVEHVLVDALAPPEVFQGQQPALGGSHERGQEPLLTHAESRDLQHHAHGLALDAARAAGRVVENPQDLGVDAERAKQLEEAVQVRTDVLPDAPDLLQQLAAAGVLLVLPGLEVAVDLLRAACPGT